MPPSPLETGAPVAPLEGAARSTPGKALKRDSSAYTGGNAGAAAAAAALVFAPTSSNAVVDISSFDEDAEREPLLRSLDISEAEHNLMKAQTETFAARAEAAAMKQRLTAELARTAEMHSELNQLQAAEAAARQEAESYQYRLEMALGELALNQPPPPVAPADKVQQALRAKLRTAVARGDAWQEQAEVAEQKVVDLQEALEALEEQVEERDKTIATLTTTLLGLEYASS